MYISELNAEKLTDVQLTTFLFSGMEDDKRPGDCIFVAGSSKAVQYRLPVAMELYEQGRASKMLFSGGVKWKESESEFPEAIVLKNEAISLGVPEKDILTEDISLHTLENVLASLLVLDRKFHLYKIDRLLVVTASYHMRRLLLTLQTYMPDWIKFSPFPAEDKNTRKDNWYKNEAGRKRVRNEAAKIIHYVRCGALQDEKVKI